MNGTFPLRRVSAGFLVIGAALAAPAFAQQPAAPTVEQYAAAYKACTADRAQMMLVSDGRAAEVAELQAKIAALQKELEAAKPKAAAPK